MISYSKKFILITPEKTGSVSLVSALKKYININTVNQQRKDCFDFGDDFRDSLAKHLSLYHYVGGWDKEKLGSIEDYNLFGAIRNPYDRAVSWWKWSNPMNESSEEFLNFIKNHNPVSLMERLNYKSLHVEKFIRFETMQKDFNSFCRHVNIPVQELPHKNQSNHRHYTEYYNDEARQIAARKYAKDIEHFGYEFGE